MSDETLLELREVSRVYRSRTEETHALEDVSLRVTRGHSCGIVGESGAGKSTILNLLLGLDDPTVGEVLWKGEPLPRRDRARMKDFRRLQKGYLRLVAVGEGEDEGIVELAA